MNWNDDDNDDFDFDFDDLSDEEKKELDREMREGDKRMRNHPLFKKANEIYKTVSALVENIPDEDHREIHSGIMMESAMMLAPKLAGAMGSDSWLICMQNASIIRYHAESLLTSTSGLKYMTKTDKDYIRVLREDMLEFQHLFKAWCATFDTMEQEEYVDEWGLFLRKK